MHVALRPSMPRPAEQTQHSELGLTGQPALVTGAGSGIGRAVALAFGAAGAPVAVNHPPGGAAAAADVVEEITRRGGRAFAVEADVSREEQVRAMFAQIARELGTLHVLVNNAGIQDGAPADSMTLAQWQRVIDVNLTGQFLCAREAIKEFRRRGLQPDVSCALGKIVCISSVHQRIPWAFETNYTASKGGLMLYMQSLAQEVAQQRIRVNAVAPGAIRTPINQSAWKTEEARDALLELIPYGRVGDPADVAEAVLWLASDRSDYVVGATLFVDGGMALYPSFKGGG